MKFEKEFKLNVALNNNNTIRSGIKFKQGETVCFKIRLFRDKVCNFENLFELEGYSISVNYRIKLDISNRIEFFSESDIMSNNIDLDFINREIQIMPSKFENKAGVVMMEVILSKKDSKGTSIIKTPTIMFTVQQSVKNSSR